MSRAIRPFPDPLGDGRRERPHADWPLGVGLSSNPGGGPGLDEIVEEGRAKALTSAEQEALSSLMAAGKVTTTVSPLPMGVGWREAGVPLSPVFRCLLRPSQPLPTPARRPVGRQCQSLLRPRCFVSSARRTTRPRRLWVFVGLSCSLGAVLCAGLITLGALLYQQDQTSSCATSGCF